MSALAGWWARQRAAWERATADLERSAATAAAIRRHTAASATRRLANLALDAADQLAAGDVEQARELLDRAARQLDAARGLTMESVNRTTGGWR